MTIHPANKKNTRHAATLLQSGKLVAFPTETVYGLGADATDDRAVAAIFSAKGRPEFNPLIVHVSSTAMAQQLVEWNAQAEKLATAFWPGPLTLVLPRSKTSPVSLLASAGGDTIGIRLPDHAVAQALIAECGRPLAAPSANRSGRVSPTTAAHVAEELENRVAMILDGGPCRVGVESAVVDITAPQPVLLRPGGVSQQAIERVLECKIATVATQEGMLKSPGLLTSHYAPSLPVRLHATDAREGEALLAFGPNVPAGAAKVIQLSERGDCEEAASRLFATLRALDSPHFTAIAVMPVPMEGMGVAINDRLERAAAPRQG